MKTIACKDMGMACEFVAKADTQEEALMKLAEHGKEQHNMTDADMTPELKEMAISNIKEEE